MKKVLAIDFGASSGRAIIGSFDGEKITLEEIHRFSNDPVSVNGTTYWDVLRLFHEIKQGLIKSKGCGKISSIGIDTWGVDFGLIDEHGDLLENPIHYRDTRTVGMIEEAFKVIPKDKLYGMTGIQFMELNTVFQLLSLAKKRPYLLEKADKLLFMPDLFGYMLTGKLPSAFLNQPQTDNVLKEACGFTVATLVGNVDIECLLVYDRLVKLCAEK